MSKRDNLYNPKPSAEAKSVNKSPDFDTSGATSPQNIDSSPYSHMHIRQKLRKFPPLREIIKEGFDYDTFCTTINASDQLTAEGKALAKDLFNPTKRISSALVRGEERARRQFNETSGKDVEMPINHPLQTSWREAWNDTKERFAKEIVNYDAMVAKKKEKRGKILDTSQYPHAIPQIIHSRSTLANAAIMLGDEPVLFVTDGFLKLPREQQKAILYHEARHGLEPVTAKVEANKYRWRRLVIQGLTLNASSRKLEHQADENAAAFGHAGAMVQALEHLTESTNPLMKELYGAMGVVAKAAIDNGFQVDKKRAVNLILTPSKPATLKKQIIAPVVKLDGTVAISMIDKSIHYVANTSTEELTAATMNPKLWGIRISTHPTTEERIARLIGNSGRSL